MEDTQLVPQPAIQAPRAARSPFMEGVIRVIKEPVAAVSGAIILLLTLGAIFAPILAPYDPQVQLADQILAGPSWSHWLGSDQLGRDILSRMLYGARVSIGIGFGAVLFGSVIGILFGLVAGYARGVVDELIMRLMEVIIAFPGLVLALMLISMIGPSIRNLLIAIGVSVIPGLARLVRSQVLTVRERDYILSVQSMGASSSRILFLHIWPNCMAPVIVSATLWMGFAVLSEAGLSFLGVGVRPPTPTWGSMLQFAFGYMTIAPYLSIIPGTAIFVLVLCFNVLGDALRDAFDPSLRGRR